MHKKSDFPEVGEMVVATAKLVKNFGAFVMLDEYTGKEGFIHISEVSSGWVKYIRDFVREGQKIVCKVLSVDPSKGHIDLSLKKVNEHQKREKIKEWKNEQKALKLFEIVARELKKDVPTCYTEFGDDLIEKYGLLYAAFEEALVSKENFKKEWGGAPWAEAVYNVAKDNIVLAVVSIQGMLEITCFTSDGAIKISRALTDIEKDEDDVSVAVQYVGPPRYRLIVLAPDYKIAEDYMKEAVDNVTAALHKCKGTCTFTRKEA